MGPKGVAVDKNGHIITVDNKACCVFIFQSNGKLVTKFGARGTSDRHFAGNVLDFGIVRASDWARFTDFSSSIFYWNNDC